MLTYLLKRIALTDHGSFGVLIDENNIPFVLTLERPWLNNAKKISCIPAGIYKCVRVNTPLHGNCFEITQVQNRDSILFHKGNIEEDSEGCILIGENFAYNIKHGKPGVASSGAGYDEFMQKLSGINEFWLRIVEV